MLDTLLEAWRSLVRHPLRSVLSALGVGIALAAIVAVVATEQSWQETVQRQYEKLGMDRISVSWPPQEAKVRRRRLQMDDVEAIRRECPAVDVVDVMLGPLPLDVKADRDHVSLNAYQVGPSYLEAVGWETTRNPNAKEMSPEGCWLSPFAAKWLLGDGYRSRLPASLRIEGRVTPLNGLVAVPPVVDDGGEGYLLLPLGRDRGRFADSMVMISASARDVPTAAKQIDRLMGARLGSKGPLRLATGAWRMLEEARAARARLRLFTGVTLACILVVAVLGLANMLLANLEERTREVALRRALGAQGRQVMGEVVCESLLVSIAGAALGCGLAYVVLQAMQPLLFPGTHLFMSNAFRPEVEAVGRVRLRVPWQALATGWIACLTGAFAAASVPALSAMGLQPSQALAIAPPRRQQVHRALAVVQVATGVCAAAVLMALYCGLGRHSVGTLRRISRSDVIEIVFLESTRQLSPAEFDDFVERRTARLREIWESESQVAELRRRYRDIGSLHRAQWAYPGWLTVKRGRATAEAVVVGVEEGLGNQFYAQEARVLQGRAISRSDMAASRRACVINDTLSERLFGAEDPLGQRIRVAGTQFLVVGVAHRPAAEVTVLGEEPRPLARLVYEVITPISAFPTSWLGQPRFTIKLRDPRRAAATERRVVDIFREVTNLESSYRPYVVNRPSLRADLERDAFGLALRATLVGSAGFWVALVGLVNTLLASSHARVREIGLVRALGATRGAIAWSSVLEGAIISAIGAALGLAVAGGLALAVSKAARLPVAIPLAWAVVVVGGVVVASCLASLLPAAQAASVPPSVALRHE